MFWRSLRNYLRDHWLTFTVAFSTGTGLALIAPDLILEKLQTPRVKFYHNPLALYGLLLLITSVLLLTWPRIARFWSRYRRTQSLTRPPLQLIDVFVVGAFSFTLVSWAVVKTYSTVPQLSYGIKVFLSEVGGVIFLWFLSSWLWGIYREKVVEDIRPVISGQEIGQYSDDPITHESQDLLGRIDFVDGLYRQIASLPAPHSFVFGLFGAWGEGKTSVLNLLQRRLAAKPQIITTVFNPWYLPSEGALIQAFYTTIEHALNRQYIISGLHRTLKRYRNLLTFSLRYLGFDFPIKDDPEHLRSELEKWLALIERRLVIIIDDIDRLEAEEILAVFKLVRLSARIQNTVFLLSFDPTIVIAMLKRAQIDPEFLEKVIQKPIPLPPAEQWDIDRFLFFSDSGGPDAHRSAIDRLLDELNVAAEQRKQFDEKMVHFYQTRLRRLFPTIRSAKRYLNGLRATLPAIVREVNLYDFFLLEAVRVFFPKIYQDIWTHPWIYIPAWTHEIFLTYPYGLMRDDEEKDKLIREHITTLLSEFSVHKDLLEELLKEVFFVQIKNAFRKGGRWNHDSAAPTYRAEKRLTHSACFSRYFLFKMPAGEFADRLIEELIAKWNAAAPSEAEDTIEHDLRDYQGAGQLIQIFQKLNVFKRSLMPGRVPAVVRAIYRMVPALSQEGPDPWSTEYSRAGGLVVTLAEEQADESDTRPLIEEVVEKVTYLPFAVLIVHQCQPRESGTLFRIYKSTNSQRLREQVAIRLRTYYVIGKRDIFADLSGRELAFVLYQWGTDWGMYTQEARSVVQGYVLDLIDRNPHYLGRLLLLFRSRTLTGEYSQFDLDSLSKIFDPKAIASRLEQYGGEALNTVEAKETATLFRAQLAALVKPTEGSGE